MKLFATFIVLGGAGMACAQINFFDNHDAGSTFTNTTLNGGNPFVLETNGANSHTSSTYWRQREPGGVTDSVLTSPTLSYSATTTGAITLSFWHKFGFEASGTTAFDGGSVEMQVNGGSWSNIGQAAWTLNGYGHTMSGSFSNVLGGQRVFSANSPGFVTSDSTTNWMNSVANLGVLNAGDTFAIRFHGASDSSVSGNGWFIDDVGIRADGVVPEPATMAVLGLGALALLRKRRK